MGKAVRTIAETRSPIVLACCHLQIVCLARGSQSSNHMVTTRWRRCQLKTCVMTAILSCVMTRTCISARPTISWIILQARICNPCSRECLPSLSLPLIRKVATINNHNPKRNHSRALRDSLPSRQSRISGLHLRHRPPCLQIRKKSGEHGLKWRSRALPFPITCD